jgi:hypothetical protein
MKMDEPYAGVSRKATNDENTYIKSKKNPLCSSPSEHRGFMPDIIFLLN